MEKFGKSQSVLRTEDNRFLTGTGKYIDDQTPPSSLFAYFFRSEIAHAKIKDLNLETAKKHGLNILQSFKNLLNNSLVFT